MCLQKPFESESASTSVTVVDSIFENEDVKSAESPRDRLPDLGILSEVSPRFKPLLVQCLSASAFTDAEFAETLLAALGGYGKAHVIPGTSDYLLGLLSIGFGVLELVKEIEQSLSRVRTWTKSLLWVYHLSGLDSSYLETGPICRFMCKYTQLALLHLGEKVLKFHLGYLFCKWSQQHDLDDFVKYECPSCDKDCVPGYLFGGRYDQYLRRKLFSNKDRYSSKRAVLAYSIIQVKRMWPPISSKLQGDALVKHRTALSGESRSIFEFSNPTLDRLSREVRRTVNEIFGPHADRVDIAHRSMGNNSSDKYVPSLSSHYGVLREDDLPKDFDQDPSFINYKTKKYRKKSRKLNRSNGGAFGYFSEHSNPLCFRDLIGMYNCPWSLTDRQSVDSEGLVHRWTNTDSIIERYGLPRQCDISRFQHELSKGQETLESNVHLVLEPAKARIITAGPPVVYHHLKPVQKIVWGILKNHPTFRLIGGVKLTEVLPHLLQGEDWSSEHVLVSADYSAATDNLNPLLIRAAAEEIMNIFGFPPYLENKYIKSLLGHTIHYPKKSGLTSVNQNWGQLMGSPSSFPILCILNAAVCRYVMEQSEGRRMKLAEAPLLINGDDAGFVLKMGDYEMWKETVTVAGLEPSPGKNYVSKHFIMLNSELHLCKGLDGQFKPLEFRYAPFVNFGLIAGQSKVLGDTRQDDKPSKRVMKIGASQVDDYDISSISSELVRGHTVEMIDKIISWFLVSAKEKIRSATFKKHPQSWFLPRSLGGLGIPSVRERYLTRGQAKLAAYLAVCPAMDFDLPGSLLQLPHKALYLTLCEAEENKLKDRYLPCWVNGEEESDQEDVNNINWKVNFTACRHEIQDRSSYLVEQRQKWDRLWQKGTDTSLEPLSWKDTMTYVTKKVTLKRPGSNAVPVTLAPCNINNEDIDGLDGISDSISMEERYEEFILSDRFY